MAEYVYEVKAPSGQRYRVRADSHDTQSGRLVLTKGGQEVGNFPVETEWSRLPAPR